MKLSLSYVVIDCADPRNLAEFYSQLLDAPISRDTSEWGTRWVEIDTGAVKVTFQEAPDHQPPAWPDPLRPQQMHLDIAVPSRNDFEAADARAQSLGAKKADGGLDETEGGFQVYIDPAGHPFCLVWE